jgi:hypothetical protein
VYSREYTSSFLFLKQSITVQPYAGEIPFPVSCTLSSEMANNTEENVKAYLKHMDVKHSKEKINYRKYSSLIAICMVDVKIDTLISINHPTIRCTCK